VWIFPIYYFFWVSMNDVRTQLHAAVIHLQKTLYITKRMCIHYSRSYNHTNFIYCTVYDHLFFKYPIPLAQILAQLKTLKSRRKSAGKVIVFDFITQCIQHDKITK
jgi:hypothetical protein